MPFDAACVVDRLRATFRAGLTRPLAWRLEQLGRLERLLRSNEPALGKALADDVGKPAAEGWLTDIAFVTGEIAYLRRHLERWAAPRRVATPLTHRPGRSTIVPEPLGVVLVIAPWNYPVQLAVVPLAGAIAAGNTAVLKPSELAPATSALLARLISAELDPAAVTVVQGDAATTTQLLEQRFDHIFYTGNGRVGRLVMAAAAKHLTPVTLELGGKSPALVHRSADIERCARRIAWGKFLNAGQTCVAPDYALVQRQVAEEFIDALGRAIERLYGADPAQSPHYGRIVNDHHFARLEALLADGTAIHGGRIDRRSRYLAPTVLVDVSADSAVMQEEIFGPILPVLEVDDLDQAIAFVVDRPKPLALYAFAGERAALDRVVAETSSGGVSLNGTLLHMTTPQLPFGGVGDSGMGAYHGRATFEVFSHAKSVLERSTRVEHSLAYPPYSKLKLRLLRRLL